jgi:hypothetical protein
VRLRSCVAIELAVGVFVASACAGAAMWGLTELRALDSREARADAMPIEAELHAAARTGPEEPAVARSEAKAPPALASDTPPWMGRFIGKPDAQLLAPLRESDITQVKFNRGGTSISLRIDLENGGRAACKPSQIHIHSQPRREIAAFRVNRLLGLSAVPPAVGRRFRFSDIVDHLRDPMHKKRVIAEGAPEKDGTVLAELSWWIPVLEEARIEGFSVDSTDGVVTWKRYLAQGQRVPEDVAGVVAQISNLVVFDFVINNADRWSGGNVKASDDGRVLYFMDNTMSFGEDDNGHTKTRTYFERAQKFSRSMVAKLRALTRDQLEAAMTTDIEPFEFLLSDAEIKSVLARRDYAIRYIDRLIEEHGEQAVLVFP